jgi:hypothetical protein
MLLTDKNQSWQPPEGYQLQSVGPEGAYLCVKYSKRQDKPGWTVANIVTVYLNDQGREVARTEAPIQWPIPKPEIIPTPVARRFRIKNGFLIMMHGIQEMMRCLRNS